MRKRIGCLILAVAMTLALVLYEIPPVRADTDGDWVFSYEMTGNGSGHAIQRYNGTAEVLEIPSSLKGHTIRWIWTGAFAGCESLRTVTFAGKVQRIYEGAFRNCINLESITIPDGTELADDVFSGCTALKHVVLPADLGIIDFKTFENCVSLERMTFGESIHTIKSGAFAGCTGLKELQFMDSVEIANDAFQGVTATVYYSATHWPEEKRKGYGGNLTWVQSNDYQIIEDENWVNGTLFYRYGGADLSIRVKAPIGDIDYIMARADEGGRITNKVLDPVHYTLKAVSDTETVLTLKASYLETLPVSEWSNNGSSGVSFHFKNGYRCGTTFRLERPANYPTQPPATQPPATEPPACVHQYEQTVTNPSCTFPGYTEYLCVICGDSYTSDFVDAPGHTFGEWQIVEEPDYGKPGSRERMCLVCQTVAGELIPPLETEPPATEPPATDPPATEPPATEPPTTEPPVTEPSATEPSEAEPSATEPSQTETQPAAPSDPEPTEPGDGGKKPSLVISLILAGALTAGLVTTVFLQKKRKR